MPPSSRRITTQSQIKKRSIVLDGHRTSLSIEDEFWNAVRRLARLNSESLSSYVSQIDSQRETGNLSSAIRLEVLKEARAGRLPAFSDE
ncbi:ribbon-helix-helix domain-containing protein [Phreatobacter oligotrophus]|uniref:ribbon-helix-helix domain-containing protein n=1 Tax=Phreatobacter oligotrophus TaxID=1122261 RepID=UPI000D3BC467|nr:ribbon-helix-helix domain-containing protein [Phreatobacter oligotrophus]